jgi:hypothetical protein
VRSLTEKMIDDFEDSHIAKEIRCSLLKSNDRIDFFVYMNCKGPKSLMNEVKKIILSLYPCPEVFVKECDVVMSALRLRLAEEERNSTQGEVVKKVTQWYENLGNVAYGRDAFSCYLIYLWPGMEGNICNTSRSKKLRSNSSLMSNGCDANAGSSSLSSSINSSKGPRSAVDISRSVFSNLRPDTKAESSTIPLVCELSNSVASIITPAESSEKPKDHNLEDIFSSLRCLPFEQIIDSLSAVIVQYAKESKTDLNEVLIDISAQVWELTKRADNNKQ